MPRRIGANQLIIAVKQQKTVFRQSIGQFIFGFNNIFLRLETFQMLLPERGDNAVAGTGNSAKLLNVADILGPHLADKNFMIRFKLPAYSFDHAHRRVIAFRRHQRIKLRLQQRVQIIFNTGFAVAAGDADDGQIRTGL